MKVLHYVRPHDLSKLHDELLAAVPALRPATDPDSGAKTAVMLVEEDYDDATGEKGGELVATTIKDGIRLTVPDSTDEQAVAAVVSAHDPTPPPPSPTQAQKVSKALAKIQADPSLSASVKTALTEIVQALGT